MDFSRKTARTRRMAIFGALVVLVLLTSVSPASAVNEHLIVTPAEGPPGTVVNVSGVLQCEGRDHPLHQGGLQLQAGMELLGPNEYSDVDADGRFDVSFNVPDAAEVGDHMIRATAECSGDGRISIFGNFKVIRT